MKIIQQPDILSFAGNVNDFVIEDVAKSLVFKLSVDGMVIVDEVYVAEGGEVRVSMKDIVDCFLSISIPRADSDYIIQSLAVKKFKAEIEDSVIEFTVVKGGISNVAESSAVFLKTQWLTLQPQEKRIVMHQPEYLSYYAVVTGSVKMTVYFADGSANETLLALEAGNLYTVDVSYLKISSKFERAVGCYDVWIENESGQRLTYVQRYILSTSNSAANVYLFENTLGGIDSVVFSGDFTEKIQTEGTVTTVLEESTDSDIDLNFSCEQNTGFIPSIDYARWLRGFFVSKQRYHVSGALRRIYLRESENGFTKNSLNDFTFEFFYSKQTKYDVVTRNRDDLPLLLEFPEVDSIPFLAPRLAEFPIAVVADDLMLPVQYAFENAWRRISIAAITQAVSEGAIDKIDLSSYWKKTELVRDGLYLKFLDKYIRAKFADDSTLWDGNAFDDYLDQAVKRDSDVQFRSFKSASFKAGPLGAGVGMVNDDEFQTDKLLVRKIMFVLEMMVQRMRFQLGQSMLTPGGGFKITRVEVHDTFYRLFFNNDGGRIPNYFVTNDQGRVQNHDGGDQKYFWGLVIATGNDYIDLSREDKDGDGVPAVGDEVVQLGNRDNPDRQDALMLTAVNGEVGMITYFGIDSFDLSGKEGSWFGKHGGKKGAVIKGEVHITSGSTGLKELEEFNEVETGINDARQVANDALALASSIVEVTASSQVFKYGYGFTGTPVPATITLTAITPKIEPTSYQWQFLNGTGWVNIESATKKTLDVMPGDPVLFPSGTNVRSFRCVCNGDEGFTDVFTLAKLADGAAGQAGSSGYTVLLTNESHTVSCDASGNPLAGELEKATTRVVVYKGVSVASFTLQNLVSAGGSFALDGDSGLKCTGLSESSATCTFEVKVDSVVIKKVFGVTKAKTGATGKAGADGKGISSTVVTYQASTSGTTVPTGTWGATIPSVSANQYLWTRTIVTYTDGTTSTSYSIGKMGANGATGAAGKGIKSTAVTYQASTSGTTVPTGTWDTTIPSVSANQYLWTRTIITYTDNTTSTSYSIGKVGATGAKGDKGDAGRGISSTVVTYQASTSGTTVPTGTWGATIPSVSANQYLWTRTIITYTDGTTSTSYSIGKMGANGATGAAGKGIKSTAVTYQASTSGTTVPTGTWGTAIPSVSANQYLWTRTIITYTDNTTSTSYSIGKVGATGAKGDKGDAGRGISSTAVTYQASTSGTTVPTGTWGTAIPSVSANQYLWTRTIITYTDNTTSTSYSIGKVGATGAKGDKGDAGRGISSTAVTYQASTSGTTVPTGTWGATIPSVSANQYLWTRTIITYTDGTTSTSYSIGKMGANGATGAAGKGIKSTAVTYQASTSGTTVPTGTWGTAIPSVSANQYLWTRTIITYTDNTTSTSYSIGKMGANGEKGDKGDKGENGESLSGKMIYKDPTFKNGVNGVSVYNNSGNGTVTVTRIAKTSDVPSDSGYCLQVKTSGTASPGSGGVVQSIQSRPDAVFIQKIIAKLPVGYKLNTASNSMGSGYSDKWLTDTAGTGKYTTYLRKITCGSSGSFSSGGHVYVTGSPTPTSSAPLVWYIAYMSCFDQTVDGYEDIVNTAYSKVEAGINSLASGITIFAKKNDFDALGNRVSSAEASIKTNASNIELKVSKNGVVSAINASPESVKISASKIDLVGKVTFAMLDSSTQTKVNGKLDTTTFNTFKGTLKGLAYKDTVLQAMKDETIIEGGYIKTSLIRTDLILSAGAQIGNFKIGAVGGASGNWLTVSDGSMGVSGSQLFFNKSDRVVYVGSHPSEGTGGQPVLGYFNIGPTTPTLKSSEKCALYAASPRHSSYLIKSYALYAEVGDVRIVDGGFGGKTQGFNLSGSSAVIDCNFLIGALFAVQSNMKITIRPGFEGQMIKLLNYTTSSVTIVKNTDGAFVSRIPGQKCGLFYFDGQNWMGLIIGDFYIT